MSVLASVGVVFGLVLIEAFFVAAEIALVSLRESQVRELAKQGRRGRRLAKLVADPNRFLATVQLGVTLTALMSSAFGAVTLTDDAARAMEDRGVDHDLAHVIAFFGSHPHHHLRDARGRRARAEAARAAAGGTLRSHDRSDA